MVPTIRIGVLLLLVMVWPACRHKEAPLSVNLSVDATALQPFHGPAGPGTDPISLTFTWVLRIQLNDGGAATVKGVHTRLTEQASGTFIEPADQSMSLPIAEGETKSVPLQASASVPAGLYPGRWTGTSTVQIIESSGESKSLDVAFSF